MVFGREPAFWIGLAVTLLTGVVTTLAGEGVISDVLKGQVLNLAHSIAELLVLLAPLIAGMVIRQNVTPVADPQLPVGTPVNSGTAKVRAA